MTHETTTDITARTTTTEHAELQRRVRAVIAEVAELEALALGPGAPLSVGGAPYSAPAAAREVGRHLREVRQNFADAEFQVNLARLA
jgi:hypothetical protein